MNEQPYRPRRRASRAEVLRRRRARTVRRVACLAVALAVVGGGTAFALTRRAQPGTGGASSGTAALPAQSAQTQSVSSAAAALPAQSAQAQAPSVEASAPSAAAGQGSTATMTAAEAEAMLADPLMVLVNHTNKMPDDYTFETKECGSATSINKTLQTAACDAFLQMQAAAAADGVTIWMQSGYRSVEYQTKLYTNKTNYYLGQGYDEATAKEKAAAVVNPPGYSEHNCGLAADLNCPEYTALDEGFKNTAAYSWLCEHAGEYGFILRYPEGREDVTDIIYEPWHWRYVGVENAARINQSGLVFEEYIAQLQKTAAGA